MKVKAKKLGIGLDIATLQGKSGRTYLVFKLPNGAFHVFTEVEAKSAARDCGAIKEMNTRRMWGQVHTL